MNYAEDRLSRASALIAAVVLMVEDGEANLDDGAKAALVRVEDYAARIRATIKQEVRT